MNIIDLLKNAIRGKPHDIPTTRAKQAMTSEPDAELLRKVGVTVSTLKEAIQRQTLVIYERSQLYQSIDRCLRGDTKIWLLDNTSPTIAEMASNPEKYVGKYVASVNPETKDIEPDKIVAVRKTIENAELVRVWLDNGEHVDCTPEHRFMLRDGTFKEAQCLQEGESLMPLYLKQGHNKMTGYHEIYRPKIGKYCLLHLLVSKFMYGTKPKGHVIHHGPDFTKLNNEPSNLSIVTKKVHMAIHGAHLKGKPKQHKDDCLCGVCRIKRGDRSWFKAFKKPRVTKLCATCGKALEVPVYGYGSNKKYCSNICHNLGHSVAMKTKYQLEKEQGIKRTTKVNNSEEARRSRSLGQRTRFSKEDELLKQLVHLHRVHENNKGMKRSDESRAKMRVAATLREEKRRLVLNHKVAKVEQLLEREDTYDITTERNHNFPLAAGIFVHNSLEHPLMSSACSLYADVATTRSQLHEGTVWVTTENKEYQYQIEKLFDTINIEEVIYDWAWTIATFGDLFVKPDAQPGVGIVGVRDDEHPITISRVDYNGRLVGFYETPMGYNIADERKILAPWEYVHFRLLGAKKRRPIYTDPMYAEFRTISIMTPDARRLTSKYGTSILLDALPTYKRLKLAEDSVLMARIGKGVLRYIYKVAVGGDNSNPDAVASLIDEYVTELKRARAMDTRDGSANFQDKFGPLSALEDIILPVWSDVNNLTVEKIGGETDIRWIKDVDELRNQLACALKVPLQLLGGYQEDLPASMGQSSLERLDIRFARQARRIQRALLNGITRLVQIHLAYQGIDPDLKLFQVQMAETSSAEEEELKNALDKGVDVTTKMADFAEKMFGPDLDKAELFDYLNKKFLKLNDLEVDKILKKPNANAIIPGERTETLVPGVETPAPSMATPAPKVAPVPGEEEEEEGEEAPVAGETPNPFRERTEFDGDIKSIVPLKESIEAWGKEYGEVKVKIKPVEAK